MNNINLMPQYVKKFNCIGQKCEDNCCHGWSVFVDKNMYNKYRNIKNSELRNKLNKNVTRVRSNGTVQKYGKIKMDKNYKCTFLDNNGLCEIHKQIGGDYLSDVCCCYPRLSNSVDRSIEIYGDMTCPEMVRIALLNEKIMEFDEVKEIEDERKLIINSISTNDISYKNKINRYFWDLRIFSISLIQNRQYELWQRLVLMGLFYKEIQNEIDSNKGQNINDIIMKYNDIIEDAKVKTDLEKIPVAQGIQIDLINRINQYKLYLGISENEVSYIKCMEEFMNGLQLYKYADIQDIQKIYTEAYEFYFKPYFKEHEYILENYLVNYIFMNLFPLSSKEQLFKDYCKMVIAYSLIKIMLIGMSAYHKKLDDAIVVRLIYSFSRSMEHSDFIDEIFSELEENEKNNMAIMSILIKN